jgi:hypothetical protein
MVRYVFKNRKKFAPGLPFFFMRVGVLDPKKGVCADPVDGGAILGRGGPDPHNRDRERRQLAPDKGRGKT